MNTAQVAVVLTAYMIWELPGAVIAAWVIVFAGALRETLENRKHG